MNPKTPSSWRGRRSARFPGTAPPQNPTSTNTWSAATSRLSFRFATVVVGGIEFSGMSMIVVTPAGRGGPGRGREPFPLGPAGFVDVDMGIDQARDHRLVIGKVKDLRPGQGIPERLDRHNPPAPDPDLTRRDPGRRQHPPTTNHQVIFRSGRFTH